MRRVVRRLRIRGAALVVAITSASAACVSQPAEQYAVQNPITAALHAVDYAKHAAPRVLIVDTVVYVTAQPLSDPRSALRRDPLSPADVPGRVGGVHLVPGADRDGGWSRDTGEVQIVRDTIPVDIPQGVRISLEVITGDRTGFVAVVLLARTRRGWAVHSVSYFEA